MHHEARGLIGEAKRPMDFVSGYAVLAGVHEMPPAARLEDSFD
jgi:hypothetical protein